MDDERPDSKQLKREQLARIMHERRRDAEGEDRHTGEGECAWRGTQRKDEEQRAKRPMQDGPP